MESISETFRAILVHFSLTETLLLSVSALLLLFSRPIVERFIRGVGSGGHVSNLRIFRAVNLLLLLSLLFFNLFLPFSVNSWVSRLFGVLFVIYIGYLGFIVLNYFIKKRFGREREINGKKVVGETYNSRALSLISAIFLFIITLIAIVRILQFDSLLEAGGVIGFVGVFLALTQGAWAPDIISGLIILNSRLVEEGDVIEVCDSAEILGVVFKTKVFHTEILNLVNNHRIMVQNSRLRQMTIHNLSKFASARGLREVLTFKIGYDVEESKVRELFREAYQAARADADIPVDEQSDVEVMAGAAGDFSVHWSVYYYTKDVRDLLRTRQLFLGLILTRAAEKGIALATPVQYQRIDKSL